MNVELDRTLSSRRLDSSSSVPSKASSLPLRAAVEQSQAFVHVLGIRFHCESPAFTIVYTSVLESQVNYSCHCDGAHDSDVPVLGSDTMPPRHHHRVDVVLAFQ